MDFVDSHNLAAGSVDFTAGSDETFVACVDGSLSPPSGTGWVAGGPGIPDSYYRQVGLWVLRAPSAGVKSFTTDGINMTILRFTGADKTSLFRSGSVGVGHDGFGTVKMGGVSACAPNDGDECVVVCVGSTAAGVRTSGPGSGWTDVMTAIVDVSQQMAVAYQHFAPSDGSPETPEWDYGGSSWGCVGIALKAESDGPPPPQPMEGWMTP